MSPAPRPFIATYRRKSLDPSCIDLRSGLTQSDNFSGRKYCGIGCTHFPLVQIQSEQRIHSLAHARRILIIIQINIYPRPCPNLINHPTVRQGAPSNELFVKIHLLLRFIFSSVGTSNEGSILTPTEVTLENPLHSRRDSSGVLQSPGNEDISFVWSPRLSHH